MSKKHYYRCAIGATAFSSGPPKSVQSKYVYNNKHNIVGVFSDCGVASGGAEKAKELVIRYLEGADEKYLMQKRKISIAQIGDYALSVTTPCDVYEYEDDILVISSPGLDDWRPGGHTLQSRENKSIRVREYSEREWESVSRKVLSNGGEISLYDGHCLRINNFLELVLRAANSKMYPDTDWGIEYTNLTRGEAPVRVSFVLPEGESVYINCSKDGELRFITEEEKDKVPGLIYGSITKQGGRYSLKSFERERGRLEFSTQVMQGLSAIPGLDITPVPQFDEEIKFDIETSDDDAKIYKFHLKINPNAYLNASATLARVKNTESLIEIVNIGDNMVYGLTNEGALELLNNPELPERDDCFLLENALGRKDDVDIETFVADMNQYPNILIATGNYAGNIMNEEEIADVLAKRLDKSKHLQEILQSSLTALTFPGESRDIDFALAYMMSRKASDVMVAPAAPIQRRIGKRFSLGRILTFVAGLAAGGAAGYVASEVYSGKLSEGIAKISESRNKAKISELEKVIEEKSKHASGLEKQLKEKNKEIADFQNTKLRLESQAKGLQQNNSHLQEQIKQLQKAAAASGNEEHMKQVSELQNKFTSISTQYEGLKKEYDLLQAKLKGTEELAKQVEKLNAELLAKNNEIEKLKTEKAAPEELETKIKGYEANIAERNKTIKGLNTKLQIYKSIEKQYQELIAQMEKIKIERDALQAQVLAKKPVEKPEVKEPASVAKEKPEEQILSLEPVKKEDEKVEKHKQEEELLVFEPIAKEEGKVEKHKQEEELLIFEPIENKEN